MDLKAGPAPDPVRREFASELKFLIAPDKVEPLRDWARRHLQADPHGTGSEGDTYEINSLYFDTGRFDVFHGNGSFGRSKYRVRRYNGDARVFLERKTKTRTWVSKRRSLVPIEQLPLLEEREPDSLWQGFWFHRRLLGRNLQPVCQINYLRTARIGTAEGHPVRMTLDRDLRACVITNQCYHQGYNDGAAGESLGGPAWIMELKYRHTLPALFKQLVSDLAPVPQRLSKYRLAITTLGLASRRDSVAAPRLAETADA